MHSLRPIRGLNDVCPSLCPLLFAKIEQHKLQGCIILINVDTDVVLYSGWCCVVIVCIQRSDYNRIQISYNIPLSLSICGLRALLHHTDRNTNGVVYSEMHSHAPRGWIWAGVCGMFRLSSSSHGECITYGTLRGAKTHMDWIWQEQAGIDLDVV